MKKTVYLLIAAVFAGLTIYAGLYLVKKSKRAPVVFKTESPVIADIVKKSVATGRITPRKEVQIKPHISGVVEKIFVEAGQKVSAGEVIARIAVIPDMVRLNEAESRLRKAKINLENMRVEFQRNEAIYKKELIPQAEFQKQQLAMDIAREELDAAERNYSLIKKGVTEKANTATNTIVRSTISGTVLDVPVKEGNSVIESNTFNDGTTVASVANMADLIFVGNVDETEVGKIKEGMNLRLKIGAIENETFNARLTYISPKGADINGAVQFEIKADVQLKHGILIRSGYSANADIILDSREKVLAIKESLLGFDHNGDSVFVEVETSPQKFVKRPVTVGLADGLNIEIRSGLTLKDKVKAGRRKATGTHFMSAAQSLPRA
jgi:HlyD family secretion protein